MRDHAAIDARSLALAEAIAAKIDADPARGGVSKAAAVCARWARRRPDPCAEEWLAILGRPWEEVRAVLLDDSEEGRRLRQNSPFCGILTPKERWAIYRRFRQHATPRA
jgi:hypothetical protein